MYMYRITPRDTVCPPLHASRYTKDGENISEPLTLPGDEEIDREGVTILVDEAIDIILTTRERPEDLD
jgi:hypothetical protein